MSRSADSRVIEPGGTIGILGNGQLGRMLALAARPMGYRVVCFGPEEDSPSGGVCDVEFARPYDDLDEVARFASMCDVVTFEFENVPSATLERAGRSAPVRPGVEVLRLKQSRAREKGTLARLGFSVPRMAVIGSEADLAEAVRVVPGAGVLKSDRWGYDGKGQARVDGPGGLAAAWRRLGGGAAIYEECVDFVCEVSAVTVRGMHGQTATFPLIHNTHRGHILDLSIVPAVGETAGRTEGGGSVTPAIAEQAVSIAEAVAREVGHVGTLAVEFFVTRDGRLLINEIAPRVHNSGHLTIEATRCSQFQQHVRAVCGLPLGAAGLVCGGAAMANLLGDVWPMDAQGRATGQPRWSAALREPGVHLHLYGKATPRIGRKMGHLTATGESADAAAGCVRAAREALRS